MSADRRQPVSLIDPSGNVCSIPSSAAERKIAAGWKRWTPGHKLPRPAPQRPRSEHADAIVREVGGEDGSVDIDFAEDD